MNILLWPDNKTATDNDGRQGWRFFHLVSGNDEKEDRTTVRSESPADVCSMVVSFADYDKSRRYGL
jgi:hypothetical protein